MPSIKNMVDISDFEGLANVLKNSKYQKRVEAMEALIEIGDRSKEVLLILYDTYPECLTKFNFCQTLRGLSYFKIPEVIEDIIDIVKGHTEIDNNLTISFGQSEAICALAATGELKAREYLEFLATDKDTNKDLRTKAKKALKLCGASFDYIYSKLM